MKQGKKGEFYSLKIDSSNSNKTIDDELQQLFLDNYIGKVSDFWSIRKEMYPSLYQVVRYIFCCSATSAPSERIFSKCSELNRTILTKH